jgi:hypothetical protein
MLADNSSFAVGRRNPAAMLLHMLVSREAMTLCCYRASVVKIMLISISEAMKPTGIC